MSVLTATATTPLAEVPRSSQASIDNVLRADPTTPQDAKGIACKGPASPSHPPARRSPSECGARQRSATPEESNLTTVESSAPIPVSVLRVRRNDPYAFNCIGDLNAAATFSFQAAMGGFSFGFGYGFAPLGLGYPRHSESFDEINTSLGGDSVGYVAPSSADVTPTKRRSPPAALSLSPVPASFSDFPCQPPTHQQSNRAKHHRSKRAGSFSIADLSIALPSPLSAHTSACPSPLMDASTSVPATPTSTTHTTGKLSRGYCNGRPIPIRTQ